VTDDLSPDLRDLLAGWSGHDLPPGRYDELLARLKADPVLRAAFAAEVWMIAKVKVALAGPPPSLPEVSEAATFPYCPTPRRRRLGWLAVAAGVLVAVAAGLWERNRLSPAAADVYLAVLIHSAGVEPEPGEPALEIGTPFPAGRFSIRSGVAVLLGLGGETTTVEGPAELELVSPTQIALHHGRIRVRARTGASGFTVATPVAAIVDLGTEFGVTVLQGGETHVGVFSGAVEVLRTAPGQPTQSAGGLKTWQAARIDPGTPGMTPEPLNASRYPVVLFVPPPDLPVGPDYAAAVRAAKPWGYWRFEESDKGLVPNEVTGGPGLRTAGAVTLFGKPGSRAVVFRPEDPTQYLVLDGTWIPPAPGFALEFWMMPESLAAQTLAALTPAAPAAGSHLGLVEIAGLRKYWDFSPGGLRFLNVVRPRRSHDAGLVTEPPHVCVPFRWHHVVAQRNGDTVELYLKGKKCKSEEVGPASASPACHLLLGRLQQKWSADPMQVRAFVGQLDEVAVYNRPLTANEIARHAGAATTPTP
jgi:hypothetical protein